MHISHEIPDNWSPIRRARTARRLSEVRRAIARGELVLHCQPYVDARTGVLNGAEALIRWQHPTRGLLAPAAWLPEVEDSSESTHLNLHIIELAMAHRERWVRRGIALPMAINVTPGCLADETFVSGVEQLFAQPVPPGGWKLELTEQALVLDGLSIDESFRRLREHGFDFMLDDFGAEHSSLSRLAMLPFTTLKIDGSLVSDIAHSRAHRTVTHAAIQLAHTLGLKAIAERVEDMGSWSLLQALACDQIQGYVAARPMPAEDFPDFAARYEPAPPRHGREDPAGRTADRRDAADQMLADRENRRTGADRRAGGDRRASLRRP